MKISSKQYAKALIESLEEKKGEEKEVVERFLAFVGAVGQTSRLKEILEIFEGQWDNKYGIVKAEVVSANPIDKKMKKVLEKMIIEAGAGKKIDVVEKVDKGIIGGIILRYGDKVLDLSLRNKLEKFKKELNS
jgi:F-type H+-transporting ATPase subunit delta